jgi:hypothetical protein
MLVARPGAVAPGTRVHDAALLGPRGLVAYVQGTTGAVASQYLSRDGGRHRRRSTAIGG